MRPLTLTIYDEISTEAVSSKDVITSLGPVGKDGAKEILIRMNSPGGEVTEGLAIYNLLLDQRRQGVQVRCRIDGMCASIATVIACAADVVEMAENAFYCVHFPMNGGSLQGARSDDLRERADLLDSMTRLIVPVYVQKTGMSESDVRALMESDRLISAQEALKLGFVDRLIPSNLKAVASLNVARLPRHLATQVPEALKQAKAKMEELDELKAALSEMKELYSKMAERMDALEGAKAEAEEESDGDGDEGEKPEKTDKADKTDKGEPDGDEPTARLLKTVIALTGEKDLAKAEGKLMALNAKLAGNSAASHAENVSKAIASKKLLPAMRAWAMGTTPEAFAAYLASVGDTTLGPMGEHKPDPAKAAELARASTKQPEEVTVTADDIALARHFSGSQDPVAYARKFKAS